MPNTANRLMVSETLFLVPVNERDYVDGHTKEFTPPVATAKEFAWADECWEEFGTPCIPGDLARAIAATKSSRAAFQAVTQWNREIGEWRGTREVQFAIKKALEL